MWLSDMPLCIQISQNTPYVELEYVSLKLSDLRAHSYKQNLAMQADCTHHTVPLYW